jgi:hypothetical protein
MGKSRERVGSAAGLKRMPPPQPGAQVLRAAGNSLHVTNASAVHCAASVPFYLPGSSNAWHLAYSMTR